MNESNYQDALSYLYSLTQSGIKLGLKNTAQLLKHFGNPQLKVRTIHIAGTNGKGSTAAIAESILRSAGYKVGLYTSPHLLDFRERIQVNRKMIGKQQTLELILRVRSAVENLKIPITFFEFGTVLAFLYFHEQNTDINVIEVGLGGRLDATNLCKAEISIITSISLDHTQYLGDNLQQIAFEKASIINEGGTVFAHIPEEEVFKVVNLLAKKCFADIHRLGLEFHVAPETGNRKKNTFSYRWGSRSLNNLTLPLNGHFQRNNAGLALSACLALNENGFNIEEEHLRQGLEMVSWEGRLETVSFNPTVVLDCAHNEDSVKNMTKELRENFKFSRCFIVLGLMQDKNIDEIIKILSRLGDQFFLVSVNPPRGETSEKLAKKLKSHNKASQAFGTISDALQAVKHIANQDDLICITGSIFLVAAAKKVFNDENTVFNSGNILHSNK
uniref:Dihydrofolate synthase/folylpolyglutamate synthase n=1 Tax=uncultured Desulfobacterales bacterium HF0200_07G10 TaxID=710741 RepID=E0XU20_9BACT|nr:folylpolyglutamate synthase [uncultured Desulfobacterales bacterium HF0200_07G10]